MVNILGSMGHNVLVTVIQLCQYSEKAATNNTHRNGYCSVPVETSFTKKALGQIWPVGYNIPFPDLKQGSSVSQISLSWGRKERGALETGG